jgi:hypothetical protein
VAQAPSPLQDFPHVPASGAGGFEHVPELGSHVPATWHESDAVQTTGFVPLHTPRWHVSVWVHALASSHAAPFGLTAPLHTPTAEVVHLSFCVHELPSSQAVPAFAVYTHLPLLGLHPLAVWHWFGGAQTTGGPPAHLPP